MIVLRLLRWVEVIFGVVVGLFGDKEVMVMLRMGVRDMGGWVVDMVFMLKMWYMFIDVMYRS